MTLALPLLALILLPALTSLVRFPLCCRSTQGHARLPASDQAQPPSQTLRLLWNVLIAGVLSPFFKRWSDVQPAAHISCGWSDNVCVDAALESVRVISNIPHRSLSSSPLPHILVYPIAICLFTFFLEAYEKESQGVCFLSWSFFFTQHNDFEI